MKCGRTKHIQLPECPGITKFDAKLEAQKQYLVLVEDKFGKSYGTVVVSDDDGAFEVDFSAPPFRPGQFMSFSGRFELRVMDGVEQVALEDRYDSITIEYKAIMHSNEPVLISPSTRGVDNNAGPITITHNLGRIPVVQLVDNNGSVVQGGYSVIHNSNNAFTITFTAAVSGTILYV